MTPRSVYTLGLDYVLAQAAAKSVSLFSAILIVRWLSVEDYALYTLLLAGYTVLVVVADLGLTGSMAYFMSSRGEQRFAEYVRGAALLRRRFFIMAALVTATGLWLAVRGLDGVDSSQALSLAMVLVAGWFGVQWVSSSFVLRVQHRFRVSYAVEIAGELVKLLVIVIWVQQVPTVNSTLLANLLGMAVCAIGGYALLHSVVRILSNSPMGGVRGELFQQILPRAPSAIYFALSQIVLVPALAVSFAPISVLAEVGALGRITAFVLVAGGFLSQVVTPLLVRTDGESMFWLQGARWVGRLLAGCVGLLAVCWWMPDKVLWVLGSRYGHLHFELLLAVAGASTTLLGSFLWELNRTRGLVGRQYWEVPISTTVLVLACLCVELSTTVGLLTVIVFGGLGTLGFQLFVASLRIYRLMPDRFSRGPSQ